MGSLTKEISELAVSESRSQGQHPDCSDEAAVQKSVKEDRAVFRYQYAFAEDVFTGGNVGEVSCVLSAALHFSALFDTVVYKFIFEHQGVTLKKYSRTETNLCCISAHLKCLLDMNYR